MLDAVRLIPPPSVTAADHIRVWPTGVVEIDTINRHQMATRCVELLKGKKHLRLVSGDGQPSR